MLTSEVPKFEKAGTMPQAQALMFQPITSFAI
jgi:hypothetical protein